LNLSCQEDINAVVAKRRTKKQKQSAKHKFTLSWKPSSLNQDFKAEKRSDKPDVKRQIQIDKKTEILKNIKTEIAVNSVKQNNLASIKKDILKSLILAGIILASEVVLYLIWK